MCAAAACSYHVRDPLGGPENHAPVAVIDDVTDGSVRVAAAVEVIVSASESTDPDGDALTYAWTIDPACAASAPEDVTSVDLHLTALVAGTQCAITVTVTDTSGASSSASATVVVVDVGAYVASTNCIASYSDSDDAPQGTQDHPFCNLQTGVDVARTFKIAEVPVANDGQALDTNLTVEGTVTIRGGYDRGTWAQTGGHTTVKLSGALGVDPAIHIEAPGENVTLANLAVVRTKGCADTCAAVDVVQTNVTLTNLDVGLSDDASPVWVSKGAADKVYYSVRVAGPTDASASTVCNVQGLTTSGAASSDFSVSMEITDAVTGTLSGLSLSESGSRIAVGLHTARTLGVSVDASVVTVDADSDPTSIATGIYDGAATTQLGADCGAQLGAVCDSSAALAIVGTKVSVSHTGSAIGIAALGTPKVNIAANASNQPVNVSAEGERAIGLFTMSTGSAHGGSTVFVSGMTATAIASAIDTTNNSFAYGWSDGIDGDPTSDNGVDDRDVFGGSSAPTASGCTITATANTANINDVAGVLLRGTSGAMLTNNTITVNGNTVNRIVVPRAAGVRLMRTNGTQLTSDTIGITDIAIAGVGGSVIDGQLLVDNSSIDSTVSGGTFGSHAVTLTSLTLSGDLDAQHPADAAPFPIRACLHLYGTATATVGAGNTLTCSLVNNSAAEPSTAGIVTVLTADVAITDNVIDVSSSVNNPSIRLVGIQDGSRQDLHLGSSRMRIERNRINLSDLGGEAVGVHLTGAPADVPPAADTALVDDNDIASFRSSRNAGIVIQGASAIVAFNSVHGGTCVDSCSQAFATGIYAMNLRATDKLSILANTFSASYASYLSSASAVPAIVERDDVVGTIVIDAIVDNVYGWQQAPETPALLVVIPGSDTTSTLDSPRGSSTYSEATINANTGATTASNNVPHSPLYCADNVHGDPSGPQHGAAVNVAVLSLSGDDSKAVAISDIDDTPRSFPVADAGADAITTCP